MMMMIRYSVCACVGWCVGVCVCVCVQERSLGRTVSAHNCPATVYRNKIGSCHVGATTVITCHSQRGESERVFW
jgi:hypothetical protein